MLALFRSLAAIGAGFVATVALSVGMDAALVRLFPRAYDTHGMTHQPTLLITQLVYTAGFAVLGSYVAALLAGRRPMLHAMILGGIAFALTVPITTPFWPAEPAWYHGCALALVLPAAWAGERHGRSNSARPR